MSNDVVENVKSKTETWLKLRGRHRDFRRKAENKTLMLETET